MHKLLINHFFWRQTFHCAFLLWKMCVHFHFRYVFWYHNDRMVNYDLERGITVFTSSGGAAGDDSSSSSSENSSKGKTKSQFIIAEATPSDSGNYTCKPSNAVPASIQVFVSNTRGKMNWFISRASRARPKAERSYEFERSRPLFSNDATKIQSKRAQKKADFCGFLWF